MGRQHSHPDGNDKTRRHRNDRRSGRTFWFHGHGQESWLKARQLLQVTGQGIYALWYLLMQCGSYREMVLNCWRNRLACAMWEEITACKGWKQSATLKAGSLVEPEWPGAEQIDL
jgi:hypothetical protein